MIKLVGFKTDAADPGSYFARNRVGDHERTLHHLPVIFDRIQRRHHCIFFAIGIPGKNFHRSFFLKTFPDLFFTVPFIDHVLPAGGVGILEVGHVHVSAGVEGVDQHLAIGRAG